MPTREDKARGDVPTCWVEIAVAALLVAIAAVVIADSLRVGATWGSDGPQAGYFPFYIGCLLAIAGTGIIVQTLRRWKSLAGKSFVSREELGPVLAMLVPTIVYVVVTVFVGIYVSSALYIVTFMIWQGKYRLLPALLLSIAVPVALFLLFEVWFLVPLPKGPVEHLLGY